jgi:hypothetical protein
MSKMNSIQWNCMQLELNWIEKRWDTKLLQKNIENLLMHMMLKKNKNCKNTHPKRCLFIPLSKHTSQKMPFHPSFVTHIREDAFSSLFRNTHPRRCLFIPLSKHTSQKMPFHPSFKTHIPKDAFSSLFRVDKL